MGVDSALVRENAVLDIDGSLNQEIDTSKIAKMTRAELLTMLDSLVVAEGDADLEN
ncbi:hypothetical protein ABQ286_13935 [Lacticaseibacillus rhamnosus]|uniref:hypothetical protein n=1 Tax=Lacticaseibacillus rhamnosus TaxID=47715 RepID=UPI003467D43C